MKIVNTENKKVVLMGPKEFEILPFLYRIALKEIENGLKSHVDEASKQVLIERKKIIQKMMKEMPEEE